MPSHLLKKTLVTLVKFGISFALLAYLANFAFSNQTLQALGEQPKNYPLLVAALGVLLVGVLSTFFRWWLLVQALGLAFPIRSAVRLGFLGFFCNFISLGSVGGDMFKAVFVAREYPSAKTKAVATVILDRIIGLYGLLLLTSLAILIANLGTADDPPELQMISRVSLVCTGLGIVAIGLLLSPGLTGGRVSGTLSRLPAVGKILNQVLEAIRIYRTRLSVLAVALLITLFTHSSITLSFYLTAHGLGVAAPTLAEHFLIVPLANLTGAIPLPMGALGAIEAAYDFLYHYVSRSVEVPRGQGVIVAIVYRLLMVVVAMIGVCYFFASRREVLEVMHEAEAEIEGADEDNPVASAP